MECFVKFLKYTFPFLCVLVLIIPLTTYISNFSYTLKTPKQVTLRTINNKESAQPY